MSKRFVVVTTDRDRQGVFAGFLVKHDADQGVVVLEQARMAIYWSIKTHGVVGLAAIGPQAGSRISPAAPKIELNGVTAVMDCTQEAQAAWEAEPWD